MEVAAESYNKVVEMAPLHLEARLSLATLQQQLGRPECALKALESMYDSETLAQDSSAAQKARARQLESNIFKYLILKRLVFVCLYSCLCLCCGCRN